MVTGESAMSNEATHASNPQRRLISSAWDQVAAIRKQSAAGSVSFGSGTRVKALAPDAFPGYRLLEEIHRGGQGVVYKAVQESTRQTVAIKVLRDGQLLTPDEVARFEQEVRVLGRLRHSNIVRIFDSHSDGEHFYYVMDYIPGLPLDEYVRQSLSGDGRLDDILLLFIKICDALAAAHLRGIIHRDLKPGNVRVDANGEPYVLDFGLSKLTGQEDSGVTQTGQFVGSMPWASPEQARGSIDGIDVRTDVYSLGVLLYQMVTWRFPYSVQGGAADVLSRIVSAEPASPRSVNSALPADLETVILTCLQKDPQRRYQSAGDLAADLRNVVAREPIAARRDSAWYVLRKNLRRYRVAAAIAGLLVVLAATTTIGAMMFYRQERVLREEADRARVEAEQLRDKAEESHAAAVAAEGEAKRQTSVSRAINEFFLSQVITRATPERMGRDAKLRDVLTEASGDVDEAAPNDPLTAGEIHLAMAAAFEEIGDSRRYERHARRAAELIRDAAGADDEERLKCDRVHAHALHEVGRLNESAELYARTIAEQEMLLGRRHPETLESVAGLGWVLMRLERSEEAFPLLREAYEASETLYGPESMKTLQNLHNLATALAQAGRNAEALPLRARHAETAARVLGLNHTSTLRSRGQLGLLKSYLAGEEDESESIMYDVLARQREKLGRAHPSTIYLINSLSTALGRHHKNDEAIALLEEGLRDAETVLTSRNAAVYTMKSNLGELHRREGHLERAEELARSALESASDELPPEHSFIGLYKARLGAVLTDLGKFDEAEPQLLEAHRVSLAALGAEAQDVKNARGHIERLYEKWNKPERLAEWRRSGEETADAKAP